jgi:FAD/FMN-containing dehydrogenase
VVRPGGAAAVIGGLDRLPDSVARGNGRSYGDASLNPAATIDMRRVDHLLDFDAATGLLACEGGVLLSELIDAMLPRGWFPPVTPGTRFVTVGGMIASDVHGKNHHVAGSFCDHLAWIDLAIGEGRVLRCSPETHADLFAATCGGMGLTGVIVRAAFRMLRVGSSAIRQRTLRAPTLDHAFAHFEATLDWTYSVAWIDCLATGRDLGRSAIMLGEHADPAELPAPRRAHPFARPAPRPKRVPVDLPAFVLGGTSVRLFNRAYYAAQREGTRIVDLDPYFYPLDALLDWNRIYGRAGFVQYQCALPLDASRSGIAELLSAIADAGTGSFLAVLKRLGPASFGTLSFPIEGYTLALDFPVSAANLALLDRLDAIAHAHGGRVYLAKDARLSPAAFAAGYPRLDEFRAVRRAFGLDRHFSSSLSRRLEI